MNTDRILELLEQNEIDYFTLPHYGLVPDWRLRCGLHNYFSRRLMTKDQQLGPKLNDLMDLMGRAEVDGV